MQVFGTPPLAWEESERCQAHVLAQDNQVLGDLLTTSVCLTWGVSADVTYVLFWDTVLKEAHTDTVLPAHTLLTLHTDMGGQNCINMS